MRSSRDHKLGAGGLEFGAAGDGIRLRFYTLSRSLFRGRPWRL